MHEYYDLVYRGTSFTLNTLREVEIQILEILQTSASTEAIKNLQMIQLQKTVLAIGIFSLFESILQKQLSCSNGFQEAKKLLKQYHQLELCNRFDDFICAINVLKHGHGSSYEILISKSYPLPFVVKFIDKDHIPEIDISEISTLIKVDDDFVLNCAELIQLISREIENK